MVIRREEDEDVGVHSRSGHLLSILVMIMSIYSSASTMYYVIFWDRDTGNRRPLF